MFSTRTGWDLHPTRWTEAVERRRGSGAPLIDLTATNPTECGFSYPPELFAALSGAGVEQYVPDPRGSAAAREQLAHHLRCEPESLLLSASTSEAYGWLFKLLCDPGDNVLLFEPSYPLLDDLARLEHVELRRVALIEAADFAVDLHAVEQAIDARTRAIVVVNPANPTGQFLTRAEHRALDALCAAKDCALICDEVFADSARGADPERLSTVRTAECHALTFALSGLSKVALLPQLKLGWTWVGGPAALAWIALQRLEHLADAHLSVNAAVQTALPTVLEHVPAMQAQVRKRIETNFAALRRVHTPASSWNVLPAAGGWSAVLRLPSSRAEEELCLRLLDAGVLVQPGYFFDFSRPGHLVVSLLPEPEPFSTGAAVLARVLDADFG